MNTHEAYVSLKVAKLLKQAGFDWETREYYKFTDEGHRFSWNTLPVNWNKKVAVLIAEKHGLSEGYSAPTLAVAQRWLREVMDTYIIPQISDYEANGCIWEYDYRINIHNINPMRSLYKYKSYEEALEAGIKKCLEIILEKDENN